MNVQTCANFNHRKSDAPVRACPMCGGVVNARIPVKRCAEASHAARRRSGDAFCLDCGAVLRVV
jgi:hypothetical protein